jgi:hypothetical protein
MCKVKIFQVFLKNYDFPAFPSIFALSACRSGIVFFLFAFQIKPYDMERIMYFLAFLFLTWMSTTCSARYNHAEAIDHHEGDSYVYGDLNGPARQTKNTYPKDSVAEQRAAKIREKFYNAGSIAQGN